MSNRITLHRLVDALPEPALEGAERVLTNCQTWPPEPPADVQKMLEELRNRLERSAGEHAFKTGGGVISGFTTSRIFGPEGDGAASMMGCEGETAVKVETRVFRGHSLQFEERLRLSDDKKSLIYSQKIKGPTGKEHSYQLEFEVPEHYTSGTRRACGYLSGFPVYRGLTDKLQLQPLFSPRVPKFDKMVPH